ncbi:long-chain-fatty-acid--CoA ligase [Kitasatospora sp. NPDC057198]|uniref:long-chain-fatty-acid--CoA ligase n=1 Tax=Kitasatospora sp. NPDC057198 TaxID=3346046 RepID=UPI00363C0C98
MGQHLPEVVRRHAQQRGSAPAISCEGRTTSYAALDSRTNRLARALLATAPPGARIGTLTRTRPEAGEVLIACGKAGLIAVPLNWRLAGPELLTVARDAGLSALVAEPAFLEAALALREALPGLEVLVTGDAPTDRAPSYEAAIAAHPDEDPGGGHDPAAVTLLLYTSGTTGTPKGVQVTLGSLYADEHALAEYRWDADSVGLCVMPMFHIAGLGWLSSALSAGAHALMLPEFDPAAVVGTMERERVTHAFFVPSVLHVLTLLPGVDDRDFSGLRLIVYGASPVTPSLLRRAMAVFGCGFVQKYGLTETVGSTARLLDHEHDPDGPRQYLLNSTGRPMHGVRVRIADPATGAGLPPGEVGEIQVSSRHNTPGYWNRPAATAELFTADGWLRTGDAGRLDEDGYLYVTDRLKDMVITGGENVYPVEVEAVLAEHPAVSEVAVIGLPHEKWGEQVTAVVVLRAGAERPAEQELIDFTRGRIASYKKPGRVHFVEAMPLTSSGKILKRALRERFA